MKKSAKKKDFEKSVGKLYALVCLYSLIECLNSSNLIGLMLLAEPYPKL